MATIALVDDDRNILTSVSILLESEGYEVDTYNDGQSALDAFNRNGLSFAFWRSPLTRKIVILNLIALNILIIGVLNQNDARENLVSQKSTSLLTEAQLIAYSVRLSSVDDLSKTIKELGTRGSYELLVLDANHAVIARRDVVVGAQNSQSNAQNMPITRGLDYVWKAMLAIVRFGQAPPTAPEFPMARMAAIAERVQMSGNPYLDIYSPENSPLSFSAVVPVEPGVPERGVVILRSASGEIDSFIRAERERVLQMLLMGVAISIFLSLVLAATIANPLNQLATAAELGRDHNKKRAAPGRVVIPDFKGRPDEIGRLSTALRGMVAALYDRIDANEQFAADVAHEIKNPLASLRSAVATLTMAKKDEQRARLIEVIDHDVRRLDRLVSDISNASRLDSELVKDEQEQFDLVPMVRGLSEYLGSQAQSKGIDFIVDLPEQQIIINGLEARLAQVFVNLIGNAISFCQEGDAVRIWVRMRDLRVLIVVEDTGPGIPEQALEKIFKRFYSERPAADFGNNSGLGLAISKQIVEAHNGVIWAENIRPTHAAPDSQPLGARFVVGLPV